MKSPGKNVSVLALNPSVDISYSIQQLLEYQKVRAKQTWYHAGGNGINIARALTELEVPAYCCSIIAGESGDLLLKLLGDSLGERHKYFRVPGETRLNTTVLQQSPPGQYEITSTGPEVSAEALADVCNCLSEASADGIAVFSGLLPPGVPESTYHDMIERINKQGGKAVVDSHGEVLQQAIAAKPWMLRTYKQILEMHLKQRMESVQEFASAARMIQQQGIEYVCVTLGDKGAVLVTGDNSYYCDAPKVHKLSTVGCGDSLLAGLIAAALNGDTPQQMLCLGIRCGSATATHPGTELFNRGELEEITKDVEVKQLDI